MKKKDSGFEKYITGRGLDVSKRPILNSRKISRIYIAPDNFYTLKGYGIEKFDFIFSDSLINATKYYRILLREWYYALKKKGLMIIRFTPRDNFTWEFLLLEIETVFGKDIKIVEKFRENHIWTFVLQKTSTNKSKPSDINNWSFGIVTMGNKNDTVDEIIKSIEMQKIPNYEIIICGAYRNTTDPHVRVIPFNEKIKPGWITRKKNIICENARYENIVVVHDRIALSKNWFKGMKKYGNNWEILSCVQDVNGERGFDWITVGYPYEDQKSRWYLNGYMEYSDWDPWVYIDGGAIILKRYAWERIKWNEDLFWKQDEDLRLSHDQTRSGMLIRFNPYSTMKILAWRHTISKIRVIKNSKRLGMLKGPIHILIGRYLQNTLMYIAGFYYNKILGRYFKPNEGK